MDTYTGKVKAKDRRVFADIFGFVKRLFPPMSSSTTSRPVSNTGKVDAKGRRVFTDTKGRTYVKGDGGKKVKKVYVKKLFTPKSSPLVNTIDVGGGGGGSRISRSSPVTNTVKVGNTKERRVFTPKSMTTSNVGKRRNGKMGSTDTVSKKYAQLWKSKVDARLNPSNKGIVTDSVQVEMPIIRLLNKDTRLLKRSEKIIKIPLTFRKGGAVDSRDIVNMRKNNIDPTWFQAQIKYLKTLSDYDIWTVAAYTHRSHEWLGKYQRTGNLKYLPRFEQEMPFPLFPQFTALIDSGYDPMKTTKNTKEDPLLVKFKTTKDLTEKYMVYVVMANKNMFSQKALELAVKMYIKDLKRILVASPPVRRNMVVYRGVTENVFDDENNSDVHYPYFSSTAYNPHYAADYAHNGRYLQRIRIPPGKHVLFLAPLNMFGSYGEYEILLPPCQFKVTGISRKMKLGHDGHDSFYKVTDLTMV
ncbi:PBCV-specific basic adaptor domain-containing protein [Paramecium bursaria Chlorella virus Fr5L]|nr:PBCV-specific basic adaptor domain-containing protein [Paramecium bursaria Chlorella virus Fr5L]